MAEIIINELKDSNKGLAYLILFGSYARGDWVYERGIDEEGNSYSYISDVDILIVTENECHDNSPIIKKAKRKLPETHPYTNHLK